MLIKEQQEALGLARLDRGLEVLEAAEEEEDQALAGHPRLQTRQVTRSPTFRLLQIHSNQKAGDLVSGPVWPLVQAVRHLRTTSGTAIRRRRRCRERGTMSILTRSLGRRCLVVVGGRPIHGTEAKGQAGRAASGQ